jgi:DNA-binding NarL/FixJ family response regulator
MNVCSKSLIDSAAPYHPSVAPDRSVRVWLVDDNARFRNLLAELLDQETAIHCTRQFPSPDAVLAALAREPPPDVILLDIEMGEQCGLDAIQPIRALVPSIQIVMLTTFHDSQWEKRAYLEGAANFLLKRTTAVEIADYIREAHRHPVARRLAPDFKLREKPAPPESLLQRGINLIRARILGI